MSPPISKRVLPSNGGLLNKAFKYVKASETDVARTFARVVRKLKEAEPAPANVKPIRAKAK